MTMKVIQLLFFSIGFLPHVRSSAVLVPKVSTAQCSGHFSNLIVTSATCDYSEYGCTYGSQVFVTGQVTANSDIPRPLRVHMSQTFPSWYNIGVNSYNSQIEDVCHSGALTPPENDDAGYSCPSAGIYNFHFSFHNPGSSRNIFSGWSGYSYGVNAHFKHDTEGGDWASCHMKVKVKKSDTGSYLNNAKFLSVAGLGIVSVAMGFFLRRRRERLAGTENACNKGSEFDATATNFELVQDHAVV